MAIDARKRLQMARSTGWYLAGALCLVLVSMQACAPTARQETKEQLRLAASFDDEATRYHQQGQYAEAESFYQRALAIREKTLGLEHPEVAKNLENLAEVYQAQKKYAEAELLLGKARAIREKVRERLKGKLFDRPRVPKIRPGGR